MAKKRQEKETPRPPTTGVDIPCPRCGKTVSMRGVGNDCYSGECGACRIEIEAVVAKDGGTPTTECYPMEGDEIMFDNYTYEEFFGPDSASDDAPPEGNDSGDHHQV